MKVSKGVRSKLLDSMINKIVIQKAAEEGSRLQQIQMIVWDYMRTPKIKRDGVQMAINISNLFEKK